jgi:hypothetical protein
MRGVASIDRKCRLIDRELGHARNLFRRIASRPAAKVNAARSLLPTLFAPHSRKHRLNAAAIEQTLRTCIGVYRVKMTWLRSILDDKRGFWVGVETANCLFIYLLSSRPAAIRRAASMRERSIMLRPRYMGRYMTGSLQSLTSRLRSRTDRHK